MSKSVLKSMVGLNFTGLMAPESSFFRRNLQSQQAPIIKMIKSKPSKSRHVVRQQLTEWCGLSVGTDCPLAIALTLNSSRTIG